MKEMAQAKQRKLQHDQDFKALWNYWKTLPADLLDTINGADHSGFLLGRLQKEGNYMSKKSGSERNLMSVKHLLSWITKFAHEPEKRLKEDDQGHLSDGTGHAQQQQMPPDTGRMHAYGL